MDADPIAVLLALRGWEPCRVNGYDCPVVFRPDNPGPPGSQSGYAARASRRDSRHTMLLVYWRTHGYHSWSPGDWSDFSHNDLMRILDHIENGKINGE